MKRNYWRINNNIRSPEVRVLGAEGEQIGVMEIKKALAKAREAGLDLVEIAPKAKPPVVKIINFGKFKYREEKKLKKSKKKNKAGELKEVRFSPFIAAGDFGTRVERIKEFLDENNKVRLVVKFKGRQMGSKKFGYDVLDKIVEGFKDRVVVDMDPKFLGRHLVMVISPTNKKTVEDNKDKKKKDKKDAKTKNQKITNKKV